ncbi:ead/Ea22-like family protein [Klebsiella pneumoniae]|uniref:ead/Ea22-like family protein n=1 Tax=Klebsiella pneumoniae TaxID=573 RepID=UPI001CBAC9D0|nr:ead/Ea22-like family protein [Klebsiella pneumoniae]MBZ1548214.1 ead/Ea22-like family protein [Klebsiella pneumoniae]
MTDITELAQRIKAAAEKATPGEWVYFPKNTSIEYDVGSDESQGSILYVDSGDFTQAQTDRNGEFIALANPANILALVEALEKAQQHIARQEQILLNQDESLSIRRGELEAAHQRIAELESRTVKLPKPISVLHRREFTAAHCAIYAYPEAEVNAALDGAGIKVEAE